MRELKHALKFWFIVHFALDTLIAFPLFLFPIQTLSLLDWKTIDPIAARIVAAALFGIGIETYLGRNADKSGFTTMLNLKIIWSFMSFLAILVSLVQGYFGNILIGLSILIIFLSFHLLWLYFRIRIEKT